MADPVASLLEALSLGNLHLAEIACFDIVTTTPSPAREVTLTAEQVVTLAAFIDALSAKRRGSRRG